MGAPRCAMILAAGRGERLRPRTDHLPKPLVSVGGYALIQRHLMALAAIGVVRVVINMGHLGEQLPARLGDHWQGMRLIYSDERSGRLETGGALVAGRHLLGEGLFLLLNGDVCTDFALNTWTVANPQPGLVLVANPAHHPQGDFAVSRGRLRMLSPGQPAWTYAGIGCLDTAWLPHQTQGPTPLAPWLRRWAQDDRLGAIIHSGSWYDVGDEARLAAARAACRGNHGIRQ